MFLDDIPQLQAHIYVDGEQLAEYDDEDTFPSKTEKTKYIEAVAGSTFEVKVKSHVTMARVPKDCLAVYVLLDGKSVQSRVIDTGNRQSAQKCTLEGHEKNTEHGSTLQRLQFAQLQTTDGPVGKAKAEDFKHLGEIQVKCYWVRKDGTKAPIGNDDFKSAIGSSVPEKCLKGRAISSHATVGAAEKRGAKINYIGTTFPYGTVPIAVFTFKYRSRNDLQIEGVIPRSPSPVPLEERDPDDLSPEEARELNRRLREQLRQQQEQIEIKKEGKKKRARSLTFDGASDIEEVSVTGEGPSRKRNRPSADSAIEVVDLTDD